MTYIVHYAIQIEDKEMDMTNIGVF